MSATLLTEEAAKALPAAVRRTLKKQCDGDWDRVIVESDGSFTVYNNARMALRVCQPSEPVQAPSQPLPRQVPPVPAPPPRAPVEEKVPSRRVTQRRKRREQREAQAAPPIPRPPSRREKSAEARALQALIGSACHEPMNGGVKIVNAPPRPHVDPMEWTFDPDSCDWSLVDFDKPVTSLRDEMINGLPEPIPVRYHPDVLAMSGVDLSMFDAAIRNPQRVEIRPESRGKRYPILAFHRGDVTAIMGFRTPASPLCIAIYAESKLDPDTYHSPSMNGGGGGGGGAKKSTGLPTSVRQMIKQLRQSGAEIDYGGETVARNADVKYKGQTLGKITVGGPTTRIGVQSDYQRTIRRMHAIDQRT